MPDIIPTNHVLNDDTVICPECYDDRVNDGGQIFDLADNCIMAATTEDCRWCGRAGETLEEPNED